MRNIGECMTNRGHGDIAYELYQYAKEGIDS